MRISILLEGGRAHIRVRREGHVRPKVSVVPVGSRLETIQFCSLCLFHRHGSLILVRSLAWTVDGITTCTAAVKDERLRRRRGHRPLESIGRTLVQHLKVVGRLGSDTVKAPTTAERFEALADKLERAVELEAAARFDALCLLTIACAMNQDWNSSELMLSRSLTRCA